MLILIHVIIALAGIVLSGLSLISPSRTKLRASYGLIAATIASGTYLVLQLHSPLMSSCLGGLMYLVVTLSLSGAARYRLAKQPTI